MKFSTSKTKATAVSLLLTFAMAISLIALPVANAQADYRTKKTYAMCGAMPNPVGVGQEVLIWLAITDYVENQSCGWEGLTVTVTKPDGTTETLGPFRTDATGGTGTVYVPDEPGNYTLQTHFPAQWFNWTIPPMFDPEIYGNIWYEASDSEKVTLVVQEESIPEYPATPLPTEYWTRPINAQHYTWNTISANWLGIPSNSGFGLMVPVENNDDAPESPHILWTKPLSTGGLAGGFLGDHSAETGDAYEGKFVNTVILNGILYYNRYAQGFAGGWNQQGIYAVDLRTGEELWFKNNSRLAFGQTLYWDSFNMHGVFSYIYEAVTTFDWMTFTSSTTWKAYDPLTGEYQFSISNIPSTGEMFGASLTQIGPKGEIIIYNVDLAHGWVAKWNSTLAVRGYTAPGDIEAGSWGSWANTQRTFDGTQGYEWNKTLSAGAGNLPGSIMAVLEDRVVGCTAGGFTSIGERPVAIWAFSLESTTDTLPLLYNTTWQPPTGDLSISYGETSLEDKVFTIKIKETRQVYGFDLDTGQKIWGPSESQAALNVYGVGGAIAYGKLFSTGYGGILYCYDVKTGELLWTYEAVDPYNEILWSTNWPTFVAFITDGKIYMQHSEHSPVNPLPRGAPFVCIDIETGEKLWEISLRTTNWGGGPVIGDNIIALWNSYDSQIYALGKGPSATTVTASPKVSVHGSNVLVEGMVIDISPGTQEYALTARFPYGVPAVADENMSDWMEYVYMQFPRPADVTGVEVVIEVLDPNTNYYEVGRTTSDASGMFHCAFTPEVPGEYTIIATFEGSDGYWPSFAETAINVEEAPAATPAPTPTPAPMTDTYVTGFGIAIIIAIAIVGLLLLRKR